MEKDGKIGPLNAEEFAFWNTAMLTFAGLPHGPRVASKAAWAIQQANIALLERRRLAPAAVAPVDAPLVPRTLAWRAVNRERYNAPLPYGGTLSVCYRRAAHGSPSREKPWVVEVFGSFLPDGFATATEAMARGDQVALEMLNALATLLGARVSR